MKRMQTNGRYDYWLLGCVGALIIFGLLMVASASMVISDKQFSYPFHYVLRQAIFVALSMSVGFIGTKIPLEDWRRFSPILLLIGFLLLVVVLVPGIGRVVNGSRRWISLGFLSLQVSEVAKLCFIVYLASYVDRHRDALRAQFQAFIKPLFLLGVYSLLLLMEPDFGSVAVLSLTVLLVLFLGGARLGPFILLFALMMVIMSALVIYTPYRLERLTTFLHPWQNAFGSGYQLTQSLIAFGRGGLFGVGLGNSVQKLYYLPEAHTDFIFAVVAEELGLMGELLVILLFVIVIFRMFKIGLQAAHQEQYFSAFICYGAALWLGIQTLINIGVNTGILPTKGLTLPFISYGGSSLLVNCFLVGLISRIHKET